MATITLLPTPPTSTDSANFSSRADTFLGALPNFAVQTNAVASEVNANNSSALAAKNAAETAKSIAEAVANFRGNWSSLTANSTLSRPATVFHNNRFWALVPASITVTTANAPSATNTNWLDVTSVRTTSTTGSAVIPVGSTSQRDSTPSEGFFRVNSQIKKPEVYDGSFWLPVSTVFVSDVIPTTAGTSVEVVNLPEGLSELDIVFNEVSTSTSGNLGVQLILNSALVTSNYKSTSSVFTTTPAITTTESLVSFNISTTAAQFCTGIMNIKKAGDNWIMSSTSRRNNTVMVISGGVLSAVGALTGVRILPTGNFDAGSLVVYAR